MSKNGRLNILWRKVKSKSFSQETIPELRNLNFKNFRLKQLLKQAKNV